MMQLKTRLSLFNLLSKLVFTALFLVIMPGLIQRINLRNVDNDLIQKREKVISLISEIGIEPFITSDTSDAFGSYNILKEEFISLERIELSENWNFIEVATRLIEGEEIEYRVLNYSFGIDGQNYLLEVGKSLSSILQTGKNIRNVMLVFLVFIITITLITDLQYTRIILIPLEKIKNKLKRISDPSLFDNAPLKTATSDFHKLDSALIELMDNINLLFRKEKEITVNISHELMTPISIIRSKLENILLIENLNQEIALKVEESLKTLHRLQNLVNSLLMIARIESDQYLREDTFSINEILLDIVNELAPIAEDADVQLEKNLTDDFLARNANKSLIISMFYNVVSNAIKNTPSGGKAIVQTFINQGKYFVTIADTGKGMTEAQMKTLFLRFKTRDKSSGDGTGIGLAISKTIADFHKIEVSVSSIEEKGTIFSFIFPEIS
jgi:signal transduction histidine kinase